MASRRRHVVAALPGTRPRGRNQINDSPGAIRRRTAPVWRFPAGEEVELEERNGLQQRLRRTLLRRPNGVKALRRLTKLFSTGGSDAVPSSPQPNELDRQAVPVG